MASTASPAPAGGRFTSEEIPAVCARRIALAAAGLALAATLTGCGGSHSMTDMTASSRSVPPSAGAGSSAADPARQGDITFAQSMIPHHEQAVTMADLALKNASSSQVKQLATQIKDAQDPEIRTMKGWLASWGADQDTGTDHSGMDHSGMDHSGTDQSGMDDMPGMMSDADLTTLAAARGEDFDTLWLRLMIDHHEGAIVMADDVLATTRDAAVKILAQAVVTGQSQEIDAMKRLLAG